MILAEIKTERNVIEYYNNIVKMENVNPMYSS